MPHFPPNKLFDPSARPFNRNTLDMARLCSLTKNMAGTTGTQFTLQRPIAYTDLYLLKRAKVHYCTNTS